MRWIVAMGCSCLALLVAGAGLDGQQTPSYTLFVELGGSIQEAIDEAPEGAVISLAAGEWQENLTIAKSLTLRGLGASETSIVSREDGVPVIAITCRDDEASSVTLAGLQVAGGTGPGGPGVLVEKRARTAVLDCEIRDSEVGGIMAVGSAVAVAVGTTISDNGHGIWLLDDARCTVHACVVKANYLAGIAAWGASEVAVADSEIAENAWYGVSLRSSSPASLLDCDILTNQSGIEIGGTGRATITNCAIDGNAGNGVELWPSCSATLVGNQLFRNGSYAIAPYERPYAAAAEAFAGAISGWGNRAALQDDTAASEVRVVYPDVLEFLMTEEGGATALAAFSQTTAEPRAPEGWRAISAGTICFSVPESWSDVTSDVETLLFEGEEAEGLRLLTAWSSAPSLSDDFDGPVFFVLAMDLEYQMALYLGPEMDEDTVLVSRTIERVAGKPGLVAQYRIDEEDGFTWLAYQLEAWQEGEYLMAAVLQTEDGTLDDDSVRSLILLLDSCGEAGSGG